jgi:hypothetical protein
MQRGRVLRKLQDLIKWVLGHIYVKHRNFNDDKEGKPVSGIEIGISGVF